MAAVDIINVVSVTQQATVNQVTDENDEQIQSALYWRQAIDVRNLELSVSRHYIPSWSRQAALTPYPRRLSKRSASVTNPETLIKSWSGVPTRSARSGSTRSA